MSERRLGSVCSNLLLDFHRTLKTRGRRNVKPVEDDLSDKDRFETQAPILGAMKQ